LGLIGERARPACRFGRLAQTPIGLTSKILPWKKFAGRSFRRDAENGTPEACAPHFKIREELGHKAVRANLNPADFFNDFAGDHAEKFK